MILNHYMVWENPVTTKIVMTLESRGILLPRHVSQIRYFCELGKCADLRNPKTLNEKILWLLHNTDTYKWTALSDKFAVRNYVSSCELGHTLPMLYGVYEDADDIDFNELPQSFVLKTNNASCTNILVKDKSTLDKSKARKQLDKWLHMPFARTSGEHHYRNIFPRIIAEEYLVDDSGFSTSLADYKVWCFNGNPHCVHVMYNRKGHNADSSLYSPSWEPMLGLKKGNNGVIPKPDCLDEMLTAAAILSKEFPQVRVDMYVVNNRVYFGELTFTAYAGRIPFFTDEWQLAAGNAINLI